MYPKETMSGFEKDNTQIWNKIENLRSRRRQVNSVYLFVP